MEKILTVEETKLYYVDTFLSFTNVYITKHSKNIIDLIEVGDYVNGKYVFDVFEKDGKKYLKVDCMYGYYSEDEIGEVVTHEQFENMVYRLED